MAARPHEIPMEAFRSTIQALQGRGLFIVLEEEGELRGHLILQPMDLYSTRHVVWLTIVVHPGHTGRGYGRCLMEYAIDWARKSKEVEKIELYVRSGNTRAIKLYESFGFEIEGIHRDRIRLTDRYVDDISMALFVREG